MEKVYLAGPINGCTNDECTTWREKTKRVLAHIGVGTIDPMRRDYRGVEHLEYTAIVEGDKQDIRDCDIFLAMAPQPSAGTSMEIFYAHSIGKPVVIVCPNKPSPWYLNHGVVVTNLEDALEFCANVDTA